MLLAQGKQQDALTVDESQILGWMQSQDKPVTAAAVAAGLGMEGQGSVAGIERALSQLQAEFEIYETGIGTGLFQVL